MNAKKYLEKKGFKTGYKTPYEITEAGLLKFMEDYAVLKAQAFAEWAAKNNYWMSPTKHGNWSNDDTNIPIKTTFQLYKEFEKQSK